MMVGSNLNMNGQTGTSTFLPNSSNSENSMTDVLPRCLVPSANLDEIVILPHVFCGSARWVVQELLKKLNDGCPANENIPNPLADDMPSLRNLIPNPGEVLITLGLVLLTSEILMIPCWAPLKIPVYG